MEPAAASGEESDASGEGELRPPGGLLHHPKYAEMMALDIGQSTQVYAAFLVLLDLLEARNWRDVTYNGSKELQLVYLHGCPGEQENEKVVVPLPVHMSLSHERIRRIMDCICNENEQEITLAAVDSDSTVVYYQLTNGFVIPDPPDVIEDSKQCRKKRKKFQR